MAGNTSPHPHRTGTRVRSKSSQLGAAFRSSTSLTVAASETALKCTSQRNLPPHGSLGRFSAFSASFAWGHFHGCIWLGRRVREGPTNAWQLMLSILGHLWCPPCGLSSTRRHDWASAQPSGPKVLRGQETLLCLIRPSLKGREHCSGHRAGPRFETGKKQTLHLA